MNAQVLSSTNLLLQSGTNSGTLAPLTTSTSTTQNPVTVSRASSLPATGLMAEYYDNENFTNLKLTRVDPTVNFVWGTGSPASSIGSDTFSVRWTGSITTRFSEEYTFQTLADGGARLWINDQLIVNDWSDRGLVRNSGRITLRAGQRYNFRLEYFERSGSATMKVLWSSRRQAAEGIPQSFLSPTLVTPTETTIDGNSSNNTLTGDANRNRIRGFAGADILQGQDGDDVLIGGTGNDRLDGGAGQDTASYEDARNGVTVNLATGIANRQTRIMPLGDSITFGLSADNDYSIPNVGGYRYHLWNRLQQNNLGIDFVGSQSSGASDLGDRDHEGHSGQTIDWVRDRVTTFLSPAQPDVVLVMLGSNDTGTADTAAQMRTQLGQLIDRITAFSPDVTVFVSTIPPARPNARGGEARIQKTKDFNALIPGLVNERDPRRVKFVDIGNLLTINEITPPPADDGLHPTFEGYRIMGNAWYDALVQKLGVSQNTFSTDQDTLISIENVVGSAFADVLIGDAAINRLEGGDGNDRLTGGLGADVLVGGNGNDTFVYRDFREGADTIADFATGDVFEILATGFGGGLTGGVSLSTAASSTGVLVNGATAISNQATFLYQNGVLRFDADGTGTGEAIVLATLQGGPATLNVNQFRIV